MRDVIHIIKPFNFKRLEILGSEEISNFLLGHEVEVVGDLPTPSLSIGTK